MACLDFQTVQSLSVKAINPSLVVPHPLGHLLPSEAVYVPVLQQQPEGGVLHRPNGPVDLPFQPHQGVDLPIRFFFQLKDHLYSGLEAVLPSPAGLPLIAGGDLLGPGAPEGDFLGQLPDPLVQLPVPPQPGFFLLVCHLCSP